MGQPAAKQGDQVVAPDIHMVMVPAPPGPPVPTPLPHPFSGILSGGLSSDVKVMGRPAATVGSTADATQPHSPTGPGAAFQSPPANQATIKFGSETVKINGQAAARNGDVAETCNDPANLLVGSVAVEGKVTVMIG